MKTEPILRFMDKVELGKIPPHAPELGCCWQWTAGKTHNGYAKFREGAAGSRTIFGYHFSYQHFVGKVPAGLQLDHLCNNKGCVNPWHLKPATGSENVFRGPHRDRGKTHCVNGHEFTLANTQLSGPNKYGRYKRKCKACVRIGKRNRYRKMVGKSPDFSERLRPVRASFDNREPPETQAAS
jgi:hypothetical protein